MSDWIANQRAGCPLSGQASHVNRHELNPIESALGNLKIPELANLRSTTIDRVADITENGLDSIGGEGAQCVGFLHDAGLGFERQIRAGGFAKVFQPCAVICVHRDDRMTSGVRHGRSLTINDATVASVYANAE